MSPARRALPRIYAGARRRLMWRLVVNGVAQAGLGFASALLIRGALSGGQTIAALPQLAPPLASLIALGLAGALLLGLRALERVDAERLGQDYVMRVRVRLFRAIAYAPSRSPQGGRYGIAMTRFVSDLNSLKNWVSVGIARLLVASVAIVGLLASMAFFDRSAAAVASVVSLVSVATGLGLTRLLRGYVHEARRRRGRMAANLGEKMLASETVRHFGKTGSELQEVRRQSRRLSEALVRRVRVSAILRALPDAVFPIGVACIAALAVIRGETEGSHAAMVVVIVLLGMTTASLRDLARAWDFRVAYLEGESRISEVLRSPRLRQSRSARELPDSSRPLSVRLRDVTVEGVFDKLNLRARRGERVLVTGPAGSGKSTLVELVGRFFDAEDGEVLLDGEPIDKIAFGSLFPAVALVSPRLPLLRGSVRDNVAYGVADPTASNVTEAIVRCRLDVVSQSLPDGAETKLREGAQGLPDGTRARIALARALASEPRLLLVDDPAFAVDDEARAIFVDAVQGLSATLLFVGPEGSAGFEPDRIWRVENGRASEEVLATRAQVGE